jgi:hypothetical protein
LDLPKFKVYLSPEVFIEIQAEAYRHTVTSDSESAERIVQFRIGDVIVCELPFDKLTCIQRIDLTTPDF